MAEEAPQDAVAMIDAILAAENQPEEKPAEEAPAEEVAEEAPAEEAKEEESEEATEKPAVAEIPLDQLEAVQLEVTVKGEDGKDIVEKPTIKELREGYMRQKDYSRKTAEVARQRTQVGEQVRQAIDSERQQYQQQLQTIQSVLIESVAPELKDVNWNDLAANNPAEYVRLRNRADQITQTIGTIQSKQKEVVAKQEAERREVLKRAAQESVQTLESEIPGWNDSLYQELMKVGVSVGYKPDEVANWIDPRTFKLLHEAHEYRKLKAGKPPAASKVVTPPKVIKPGATTTNAQSQQRHSEAMKQLQKSGNVQDAAAVIRARMGF